jgi:hypothetical protein
MSVPSDHCSIAHVRGLTWLPDGRHQRVEPREALYRGTDRAGHHARPRAGPILQGTPGHQPARRAAVARVMPERAGGAAKPLPARSAHISDAGLRHLKHALCDLDLRDNAHPGAKKALAEHAKAA